MKTRETRITGISRTRTCSDEQAARSGLPWPAVPPLPSKGKQPKAEPASTGVPKSPTRGDPPKIISHRLELFHSSSAEVALVRRVLLDIGPVALLRSIQLIQVFLVRRVAGDFMMVPRTLLAAARDRRFRHMLRPTNGASPRQGSPSPAARRPDTRRRRATIGAKAIGPPEKDSKISSNFPSTSRATQRRVTSAAAPKPRPDQRFNQRRRENAG
jgi:hypothetical protein